MRTATPDPRGGVGEGRAGVGRRFAEDRGPATKSAAAAPAANGGNMPARGARGSARAAQAPTPLASAATIAPSAAASSRPATASVACHTIGSVVRRRIASVGHMTAMPMAAAPNVIANVAMSAVLSHWLFSQLLTPTPRAAIPATANRSAMAMRAA